MAKVEWKPVQMYCLNCATKLTGYRNAEGKVKFMCPRCRVIMVSQMKGTNGSVQVKLP